jgi:hypothetical protein
VQVISALEDGSQGVSSLVFGGNPGLPTANNSKTLEITNEVSWLSPRNGHRPKLGLLFNRTTTTQSSAPNRYGSFTYNSLADLEAGIPPRSAGRWCRPSARAGHQRRPLADTWRVSPALQLTWGGRLEYSVGSGSQGYSAAVDSLFGRRTDALPRSCQPRVGFLTGPSAARRAGVGGPGAGPGGFGGLSARGTTIRGGIG